MSLFAGIVARGQGRIAEEDRRALERLLARDETLPRQVFRSEAHHLVHVDLRSHGSPGTFSSGDDISLIAGDPILDPPHGKETRVRELEALHGAWRRGDEGLLSHARGTFALAHVGRGRVTLVTDRIGLRPLHLWIDSERVVFSTSLRVMEELACVPKRVDLKAAGELLVFGYPLADRTPYAGIRRLEGGLQIDIAGDGVSETRYWRPEDVRVSPKPAQDLEREAFESFRDAVRLRRRGDRSCLALLSGGLDSRCVVALLRDAGAHVHTIAFSYGDEQDHVFSRKFAEAAGTAHRRHVLTPGPKPNWGMLARAIVEAVPGGLADPPSRPTFLWTGDNGSFTVGFVHLSDGLFARLRSGQEKAAVDEYLRMFQRASRRVLKAGVGERLDALAREGLAEQLGAIRCDDPAKRVYVLYLMTEARHILSDYFEQLDRHRLDTSVPFCDGKLLDVMLSIPMDAGLRHEFYHRFLSHFPPVTVSVPWQTYPGHAPCPVPHEGSERPQWQQATTEYDRLVDEHDARIAAELLRSRSFPDALVSRSRLRVAAWAHRARVARLGYMFRAAATLQRICAAAGGRLADPHRPARAERVPATTGV